MKKLIYVLILLSQLSAAAWAQAFVVRRIEFQGLQRISPATVESYLPIKRGQTLSSAKTADVLRVLYKTGFFDHISLSKADGTLIINVVERATIGQLKITGNSVIPTDKLTAVMKSLDVAEGRIYNAATLDKIKQGLLNQYYQLGRYNARVDVKVAAMARNRVSVTIDISEGLVAKIRRITIIGNHVFDESTLVKQLDISTVGIFTVFTQSDRYSEERLEASMEKLRAYYLDRGYVRFEVKSAQAQVTPDRKSVYVNIVVEEGKVYTLKSYDLVGKLVMPRAEYLKYVTIKPGETFSRQKVIDSEKAMSKEMGDKGYMYSTISLRPHVNELTREVTLTFDVDPGKRVYVRQVTFSDNNRTNDEVLRREVLQFESAPVSTSKLDESKQRLSLLPFIRDVEMSVNPSPGMDDKVDINYKVKEDNSAQATFKVGYSQAQGVILGAGLNQKNFFGTGNTLGINLSHSKSEEFLGVDYTNPYYTADGISRSYSMSVSRVDPGKMTNVTTGYTTSEYSLGVLYGIPVGQERGVFSRISAGVGYQDILIDILGGGASKQVTDFVDRHGRRFDELDFKVGYSRDSRDKAIFATRGVFQTLFFDAYAPLSSSSLSFYTFNYHGRLYQPLIGPFILTSRADLGYGNAFNGSRNFPFFKNYFAGGIDSVRGYLNYNLGPHDSDGKAFGGNILADGSIGVIFPNYIWDNLRTSVFVDGGNVYETVNNRAFGGLSTNSGPIRYSVGLEADVITPFGPIALSLAKTINKRHAHGNIRGDEVEPFQFSLGANF